MKRQYDLHREYGATLRDDEEPTYSIHPTHSFLGSRCMHCDCDDHSLANPGELPRREQPCPVEHGTPERTGKWTFPNEDIYPPMPEIDEI